MYQIIWKHRETRPGRRNKTPRGVLWQGERGGADDGENREAIGCVEREKGKEMEKGKEKGSRY